MNDDKCEAEDSSSPSRDEWDEELEFLRAFETLGNPIESSVKKTAEARADAMRTPHTRSMFRDMFPSIESAENAALRAVTELGDDAVSRDPIRSDTALDALQRITFRAFRSGGNQGRVEAGPHTLRAERAYGRLVAYIRASVQSVHLSFIAARARAWTWVGVGVTLVAATAIAAGRFRTALALIVLRVAMSMLVSSAGTPADASSDSAYRIATRSCVAGHVADAVVLLGCGAYLHLNERPVWGLVVMLTAVALLGATLFRVSALQEGVWIRRSALERATRIGSSLIALCLAAVFQPSLPTDGFPVISIAAFGALLFAIFEVSQSNAHLRRVASDREDLGAERARIEKLRAFMDATTCDIPMPSEAEAETV